MLREEFEMYEKMFAIQDINQDQKLRSTYRGQIHFEFI